MKERPETQEWNYNVTEKNMGIFPKILFYLLTSILLFILIGIISFTGYAVFLAWGSLLFSIVIVIIALIVLLASGKVTLPNTVSKISANILSGVFTAFFFLAILIGILIMSPLLLINRLVDSNFELTPKLKVQKMIRNNDIDSLLLALKSEDWDLRYKAANALEKIKDKRVIEPLAQFRAELEAIDYACYSKSRSGICPPWY